MNISLLSKQVSKLPGWGILWLAIVFTVLPQGWAQMGQANWDRLYVDEDYRFSVAAPADWERMDPAKASVPGQVCRAWAAKEDATLILFRQKPDVMKNAQQLLEESAQWLEETLDARVLKKQLNQIAGYSAMDIVVVGQGTGVVMDGSGGVSTAQRWVAIPREQDQDVIAFLLTAEATKFRMVDSLFQSVLSSLRFGDPAKLHRQSGASLAPSSQIFTNSNPKNQ